MQDMPNAKILNALKWQQKASLTSGFLQVNHWKPVCKIGLGDLNSQIKYILFALFETV